MYLLLILSIVIQRIIELNKNMELKSMRIMEEIQKLVDKYKILRYPTKFIGRVLYYGKGFDSGTYWRKRYAEGDTSGAGSYGKIAEFKAEIINNFIKKNNINLVMDFGCGDGNQLTYLQIPHYIGLDVSKEAINICKKHFLNDKTKSFFLYGSQNDNSSLSNADLSLSLEVIFHLVEDEIFEKYMHDLFSASTKFVIIFSSNTNKNGIIRAPHCKNRLFSKWIEENLSEWKLIEKIKNKYPNESISDFYIYKKIKEI